MPGLRRSKYRNIYADNPKQEQCYQQIPVSSSAGEHGIAANEKYLAVCVKGGGGPFAVLPHDQPSRYDSNQPLVRGHAGAVLNLDWNPFNSSLIASGSEDQTVKVWGIPEGGLTENITKPLVDLQGHSRPVTHVRFHPTAENLLAGVDKAHKIKLWDISTGGELTTNDKNAELIQDFCWNYTGNQYATSSKDKILNVFDARSGDSAAQIKDAHGSTKAIKIAFLGESNRLLSVGFTRSSEREVKIWDPRNPDKPLMTQGMGQGTGVAIPVFDQDINVLYLACKGDTTIKYFEIMEDSSLFPLSVFTCPVSAVGIASVPKRGLDIMSCETARLLRMTNNSVDPLKFIVPRTSQAFQDDLFPDSAAPTAAHTAAEWMGGSEKPPVLMSLDPKNSGNGQPAAQKEFKKVKGPAELQAELDAANKRIAELEAKLKAAGIEA